MCVYVSVCVSFLDFVSSDFARSLRIELGHSTLAISMSFFLLSCLRFCEFRLCSLPKD